MTLGHASRPYGQNAWAGKAAGIIGTSPGNVGTAVAHQHPRVILAYRDLPTLGQPQAYVQIKDGMIDQDGGIGPASRGFLQGLIDRYCSWVKRFAD